MPLPAKIRDALQRAITQLHEAILACTRGRDEEVVDAVWRGASEIEYLTFLLSLARGEMADPWKARRVPHAQTFVDSLRRAEEQLTEALTNNADPEVVYRLAWQARGHALDAQRRLDATLTRRLRRS
jgi:hypothetical protein